MVTLLSEWGEEPKPAEVKIDPSVDMKTPPKTPGRYRLGRAAELLKFHPPHLTDQPRFAGTKRIGIEPGRSCDLPRQRQSSRRRAKRFRRTPQYGLENWQSFAVPY